MGARDVTLSLESIFDGLDVEVEPFAVCEVRGKGRLALPPRANAVIHFALAGEGRLIMADRGPIGLISGTVVIVPPGKTHRLESSPDTEGFSDPLPHCAPLPEVWERIQSGEGVNGVLIACGDLKATYREGLGLFEYLTEPIVENLGDDARAAAAFRSLLEELALPRAGTGAMARALMLQCLVAVLRRQFSHLSGSVSWLAALENPRLGGAIRAMVERPGDDYSLEGLADGAGMSRSSFVEHFSDAIGKPPIDFLRDVRLRRAATLLRTTDRPVKSIAASVGYRSRSYFSRAFKAQFGVPPETFRDRSDVLHH